MASYAGLVPRVHSSGGHTCMGQVCGNVNRNLKWAFVETANLIVVNQRAASRQARSNSDATLKPASRDADNTTNRPDRSAIFSPRSPSISGLCVDHARAPGLLPPAFLNAGRRAGSNFLQRRSGQSQHRRLHAHVVSGNRVSQCLLERTRFSDALSSVLTSALNSVFLTRQM